MSRNANAFTPAEDAALAYCLHKYGPDWKARVREYAALDGRSPSSCEKHLWYTDYFGLGGSLREACEKIAPVKRQGWPKAGKRLFFDDPRAEADHGSPGRRIW